MYLKICICLAILSCNNKEKLPNFSVNDTHKTEVNQPKAEKNIDNNFSKKNEKGFIVLDNNYNPKKILTLYNLDKSKWKDFKFSDNFSDDDINPYVIKPENILLVFKCLEKEKGFYKVVVNDEKNIIKYIKESDLNFKFQTTEQHILSVFSVEFNGKENPLRIEPNDKSKEYPLNKDSFYYPIKIQNNWLMVEDDNKEKFWVKWCDREGNLIINLYYDA